ncbi:MAG: hypothetical protein Q7J82_08890 [Coriobacteriia bacterium]|nr:hypothetical protein [Coriobacteriia bacterium]
MRRALLALFTLDEADKATDGALVAFCESCHTPIAVMAGELPDREFGALLVWRARSRA